MHESSLAKGLLHATLEAAARHGARRVSVVRAFVAETEALSGEALGMHFEGLARGTVAEGARLELELVHVRARCATCGHEYEPEHHVLLCPACDGAEGELLGETGLGVRSLDVE
jgi:hydrogenase nickel incorporation protein HypA/HybF